MNITENYTQNSKKVVSQEEFKIGFFHYFFDERSAGVNRVIENNIEGLKIFYPNVRPVLIAGEFQEGILKGYEKKKIELYGKSYDPRLTSEEIEIKRVNLIKNQLRNLSKSLDGLVVENALRGIDKSVTKGVRDFSERAEIPVIYRNHDFLVDYPDDWKSFLAGFRHVKDAFPQNPNVLQLALTSSTQYKIDNIYDGEAGILRNSVVCEDFARTDLERAKKLRELFEEKDIVSPGEKIVSYPVRIDQRKNVEEALFIIKTLNEVYGENYKLIVTATRDKDYSSHKENVYQRTLEEFAETNKIPCSLGKVFKYIDEKNFTVGDLYHISDLALTTAVKEGFGYAYVEPWVAGTALIGRRIREVCEDFEANGMDFKNNLYDSSILKDGKNWEKRIKRLNSILKDKKDFKEAVERLDLPMRIESAKEKIDHNARVVRNIYGHDVVAKDLAALLRLPDFYKIKLNSKRNG